jgi:hypothetical protein
MSQSSLEALTLWLLLARKLLRPLACATGSAVDGEGVQGWVGPWNSHFCCTHPTVDRCWAAGPLRAAFVPVLAVTAKLMRTTTASSRP